MIGQKDEMIESGYFDEIQPDYIFEMECEEQAREFDQMYDPFICGEF